MKEGDKLEFHNTLVLEKKGPTLVIDNTFYYTNYYNNILQIN